MLSHYPNHDEPIQISSLPNRHLWEIYADPTILTHPLSIIGADAPKRSQIIDQITQITVSNQWPTYLIDIRGTHDKAVTDIGGKILDFTGQTDIPTDFLSGARDSLTSFNLHRLSPDQLSAVIEPLLDAIWAAPKEDRTALIFDDIEPIATNPQFTYLLGNMAKRARKAMFTIVFSIPSYLYNDRADDHTMRSTSTLLRPHTIALIMQLSPGRYKEFFKHFLISGPLMTSPDADVIQTPLLLYNGGACLIDDIA